MYDLCCQAPEIPAESIRIIFMPSNEQSEASCPLASSRLNPPQTHGTAFSSRTGTTDLHYNHEAPNDKRNPRAITGTALE